MTTRTLPRCEWTRLVGTELEQVWPLLNPETSQIVVVEDDAQRIIGCWAVMTCIHVEGVWIDQAHRGKGSVARRLLSGMRDAAEAAGATAVLTAAASDEVRGFIDHLGGSKVVGDQYLMPLRGPRTHAAKALTLGRSFHAQLATLIGEPSHADNDQHDLHVGLALLTAVERREPARAMREYNAWARTAGYASIQYLGTEPTAGGDLVYRVDIQTAIVTIDAAYQVRIEQGVTTCQ